MKLTTAKNNVHGLKIVLAAEFFEVQLSIELDEGCKKPSLQIDEEDSLSSPNAAVWYMSQLKGRKRPKQQDEWLDWEACELASAVPAVIKKHCDHLESKLKSKFIIGDMVTPADIAVYCSIYNISPDGTALSSHPKSQKWFDSILASTQFKNASARISGEKPATSADTQPEEDPITSEEIDEVMNTWNRGNDTKPKKHQHPILPVEGERNVLITSALPYVNNVPHLGNIIGCVLSADVYARYCRMRNYNTLYICGTDEYGTATETKALEERLTPQEICDKYYTLHDEVYRWFGISFDHFGRTTTPQQTKIAQDIFMKLYNNNCLTEGAVDQFRCTTCNMFLADRYVEGTCPLCAYEDARGDQCDKCSKLVNATELGSPRCKICRNTPVIQTSRHLFLDLPQLESRLVEWMSVASQDWTANARVIAQSWVKEGLKPRCITRDLKWGTPVPLEKFKDKVFYVWFDAPIGYLSITACYTDEWEKWWKNRDQVVHYEFMAKDNVPFHSVVFPASQLGTGDPYTLVNNLMATEYLNYEDGKFSKSRGVGVFGNNAQETGIPADVWRFYLLYVRPESQDSTFSWTDLMTKNNNELLNNIGNFANRALSFVDKNFDGVIPAIESFDQEDKKLLVRVNRQLQEYLRLMEAARLREAIRPIFNISRLGNQRMQGAQPWVLIKGTDEDKRKGATVIALCSNIICLLSVMLLPYMPNVSKQLQEQLNVGHEINVLIPEFVCRLPAGHRIGKPAPIFQKIEEARVNELKERYAGGQQKTSKPQGAGPVATCEEASVEELTKKVAEQGDLVRQLKANKAEKAAIEAAVAELLNLKKLLSGAEGKTPEAPAPKKNTEKKEVAAPTQQTVSGGASVEELTKKVAEQGDQVRQLKANKAEKAVIDAAVAELLNLKKLLSLAEGKTPEAPSAGKNKKKGNQK